jgi:AcrR family transcriptional regulator
MREKDPRKVHAIYDATLKLVLDKGFTALKINDVARTAGIATGTIYIYFDNKEDLINQLYLELQSRRMPGFLKGFHPGMSVEDGFKLLWHNYISEQIRQPEVAAFLEQYFRSPYLAEEVRVKTDTMLQPIFEVFERGKQQGILKPIPTDLMVAYVIGSVGELIRWQQRGIIQITDTIIDQYYQLAWDAARIIP